ncbi:hypothetical protein, partial [Leyella stercorea]|uniref:hypothetical protein n=1 Tax=Leyella stercorea TaxID=363265 RepID=UPI00242BAC66
FSDLQSYMLNPPDLSGEPLRSDAKALLNTIATMATGSTTTTPIGIKISINVCDKTASIIFFRF